MLVRVSTWTRAAPGAGRGGPSHLHKTHQLDPGIRYHRLLRFDRERATHGDDRKANQRWQRSPVDTEVDSSRSHRRGPITLSETGTGQGQTISPLLANVYLHYVLDEWFKNEVKPRLRGAAHEIRFADDAVLCFQYREDAEKVMEVLPKRFAKYGLTLHPEKTRLVDFGRYAEEHAKRQGKKPATFDFLGFTHFQMLLDPLRGNLHGGVCEGGEVSGAMVDLNAHEAGNGG